MSDPVTPSPDDAPFWVRVVVVLLLLLFALAFATMGGCRKMKGSGAPAGSRGLY